MKVPTAKLSILTLTAVNLLPLIGVLSFDWDVALIVLLYWTENLIVGSYNVLKMLLVPFEHPAMHLQKLFAIPFFCLHFGGFCAIHGAFLLAFFNIEEGVDAAFEGDAWPGPFLFLGLLFSMVSTLWRNLPEGMELLVVCLAVSHGISFVQNFLIGKESASATIPQLMGRPYARIVLLHIAIIGAGIPIMMLGSPVPLVIILILMKIGMDIWLHVRSHKVAARKAKSTGTGDN